MNFSIAFGVGKHADPKSNILIESAIIIHKNIIIYKDYYMNHNQDWSRISKQGLFCNSCHILIIIDSIKLVDL